MIDYLLSLSDKQAFLQDLANLKHRARRSETAVFFALVESFLSQAEEEVEQPEKGNGQSSHNNTAAKGWVELKMINGHGPYAYKRWYEGTRKRSEYVGKVKS